jgi:hypothetical protein
MKPATWTVIVVLGLVSLAQLLRALFGVEILAGGRVVPIWLSVVAFLVTGGLAIWLWREHRPSWR